MLEIVHAPAAVVNVSPASPDLQSVCIDIDSNSDRRRRLAAVSTRRRKTSAKAAHTIRRVAGRRD